MLCVLPQVRGKRDTAHPLSRSELGLPEPRAAGFCRNPVEILPKWAKKWSCASSCTRETKFLGLIRTPARSAVLFESGGQNRRCRLNQPHHRGENFHLMSPVERQARFGVPLVQRVPPPAVPSQVPTAHAHVDEQKEPRESAHSAWRRKQAATTRASPCAVDGA